MRAIDESMSTGKLFEGYDISECSPNEIRNAKKLYNYIVESAEIAEKEGKTLDDVLDEGIFGALVGGTIGATAGVSLMKGICKALGISETGILGNLLTSRLVIGAVGSQIGYN